MSIPILPIPLLAANEIQAIIFVLFLLFSFIGFISNLVKGNAANQRRQVRGGQQGRPGQLQNEIDDFLKDVLGEQPAKRPGERQQVEFVDDDLVVVDESESRRQQAERERQEKERRRREARQQREDRERRERLRRQQEAERQRRERDRKKESAAPVLFDDEAQRPGQTLKDRHLESNVESHVKTYMNHAVEEQRIGRGTVAPLPGEGLAAVEGAGAEAPSSIAQQLHAVLRSPQGVRQAILVNEILSKPKALQSRSA